MADRSCVVCRDNASEGDMLELPCWAHYVCKDDVAEFFKLATEHESLYPPKCCDEILLLEQFEQYIPAHIKDAFLKKAQGEYQILQRFRVYCANAACGVFLNPAGHVKDSAVKVTYAICEEAACEKLTCVTCRSLITDGIESHICQIPEAERQFKEMVREKGYQQCANCGHTVELTEACNHITCQCGHGFCYICGREWRGGHGCPQYGPETYDSEGYGMAGYHRDTGLNREGLTYRQVQQQNGDGGGDSEEEEGEDEQEQNEENMPDWDVLQHLDEAERAVINALPSDDRNEALEMTRIELMETRGIIFSGQSNDDSDDQDNDEEGSGEQGSDEEDSDGGDGDDEDSDDDEEDEEGEGEDESENADDGDTENEDEDGEESNSDQNDEGAHREDGYLRDDTVMGENPESMDTDDIMVDTAESLLNDGNRTNEHAQNDDLSGAIEEESGNNSFDEGQRPVRSIAALPVRIVRQNRVESLHAVVESASVDGNDANADLDG